MTINGLWRKYSWNTHAHLVFSGILFFTFSTAHGLSCAPLPAPLPGQNQHQASVQQLAASTVRMRIADSALVMQGKVESISDDYASLNWTAARLAVVQTIRTFKGDTSTKYEVLVPIDTQLGDEVVVFANLENLKEIQLRIDRNSRSLKPNLKWTQTKNPIWIASAPCIARTYSTKKFPEIAGAVKQVFSAAAVADLFIETRVYLPGSPYQTALDEKIDLNRKNFELISAKNTKYSSPTSKQMSAIAAGLVNTTIENLPEGRYVLSSPKITGLEPDCSLDFQDFNCSSVDIKSYAIHKLRVDYKPSARVSLNQVPDSIQSLPIEYEFVALDAGANQPKKINHVSGVVGDRVFLYPGKYNLFAVIVSAEPSKDRRIQITQNGNKIFRLNEGVNEISVEVSEFIDLVETTVRWQLPSDTTEAVSTSFQLLANANGYGRVYQKSAHSSCNSNECKLVALRGQSIEVTAATHKSPLTAKKILRVGDESTVNLTLAPTQK
jgi:hypothetical protein